MPRASSSPRLSDTKLPCTVAHASVVLSGGSIAHISGDKALVLCQPGSQGTLLTCSSRRRRGDPLYLDRTVTTGPHQGEVSVLGRLDLVRTTAASPSCCAGAPTSCGTACHGVRHARRPFTACTAPRWSLPTTTTLRPTTSGLGGARAHPQHPAAHDTAARGCVRRTRHALLQQE
jgi:hypothetical protein